MALSRDALLLHRTVSAAQSATPLSSPCIPTSAYLKKCLTKIKISAMLKVEAKK